MIKEPIIVFISLFDDRCKQIPFPNPLQTWLVKNPKRCLEGFQIKQEKKNLLATLQRFRFPFTLKGRQYIKDDALPSIFPWSVSSPNRKLPRKRQNVVEMPSSCSTMDNLETTENNKGDSQDKEIADLEHKSPHYRRKI